MINRVSAGSMVTMGELKKMLSRDELADLGELKESIIVIISGYLFENLINEDLFKEYVYFLEVLFHEAKMLIE